MAVVQPKTIAESLSNRIAGYQYEQSVPELVLRGFKKDANKLIDISPAHAYHFLGQVAALENKTQDVINNYDIALNYSNDSILYYNYAVSLIRVGQHKLALQNLKKGFEVLGRDVNLVIAYANAFSSFFSISYVRKLVPLLTKYRVEQSESIKEILKFFSEFNIQENVLEELMINVRDTIYSHNFLLSPTVKYQSFDNSFNVSFIVSHFNSLEQLFDCNYHIAETKINLEDKYNIDLGDILISCEVA